MLAAIEFYRSQTQAPIEIGFIDATRADVDYLMRMVESACKAGANHITLADTVSAASPEGIEYLVSVSYTHLDVYKRQGPAPNHPFCGPR